MVDHLAGQLCDDEALELALKELADLQGAQGPGKHLRVPARSRIMDDWVVEGISSLAGSRPSQPVQVVSMGAGLDTRPWRLDFPAGSDVRWICVDFPNVMTAKHQLLAAAGAETGSRKQESANGERSHSMPEGSGCKWPLHCSSWHGLGLDLSDDNNVQELGARLEACGFRADIPTVWVIEAVLYYMPLEKAEQLLQTIAMLSTDAILVATCVDNELLEASRNMEDHIFAKLWYFDCDELHASGAYKQNWSTVHQPQTTKQLAKDMYKADTYVALYGGAECAFTATKKTGQN
eukprot:CAMPEP_0202919996 /NCGR_PEP_ID=MMETSP1392-20130828/76624_1 /ASSEMBLY_ACC=CAM_ASM_000868 /TAXON_ID=225041 /ORGANISM="Chlamydomonas chlamydogama, Strain SAG 11-48b" /LENGTH=291 /DNA_ID=CAMNT_0049613471 /DNA_START=158 /DNA_END=1033 /DNA_ORIENTATION=+